jgi:hypothetical protein
VLATEQLRATAPAPPLPRVSPPSASVSAVAEDDEARTQGSRAGLILCGLFGEDPSLLEGLVGVARSCPAVVGIDLAGGPSPAHRHQLRDDSLPFSLARDLGLGRTVHAGERTSPRRRSARRSSSCTRNASAMARPRWPTRRCSISSAIGA